MKRRGASLVWAVVLCGVMMLVVGTMSSFIIKESRMSIRMDDSARAYAAAESGLDWGRLCLVNYSCRNSLSLTTNTQMSLTPAGGMVLNGSKYYVVIKYDGTDYTINSRGESNLVNREIEFKFKEATAESIDRDFEDDGSTARTVDDNRIQTESITADGSFTLGFYYWVSGNASTMPQNAVFGIRNPNAVDLTDEISVVINEDEFDLKVLDKNQVVSHAGNSTATTPIDLAGAAINSPYSLYINLKYLRNTSARLTVMLYNPATGNYDCRGTKTVFLPNKSFDFGSTTTTTKFVHEFSAGGGNFSRIEGKPAVDPGSGLNEDKNFLYRFSSPTASPSRFGYLDNFSSTGIVYQTPTSFNLTVAASPASSGSVSPASGSYSAGSTQTLVASPITGKIFSNWSGSCSGTNSTTTVVMNGTKSCTANFINSP